jgi:hypothetical protein
MTLRLIFGWDLTHGTIYMRIQRRSDRPASFSKETVIIVALNPSKMCKTSSLTTAATTTSDVSHIELVLHRTE